MVGHYLQFAIGHCPSFVLQKWDLPVVNEGEGALGVDDGDFGELQNFGRHLEVNRGSKHFAILKRIIGRRRGVGVKVGDEDDLAGRVVEVDSGGRHWEKRMMTFLRLEVGLYPSNGCLMWYFRINSGAKI